MAPIDHAVSVKVLLGSDTKYVYDRNYIDRYRYTGSFKPSVKW